MRNRHFLAALLSVGALALWPAADTARAQPDEGGGPPADTGGAGDAEETGEGGAQLRVVPPRGRLPIGMDRQFRVTGSAQGLSWVLVDVSAEDAATLSDDGLLSAHMGGWALVGVADAAAEVVASTDTVWLAGGPTGISSERGGRAFAAQDTFVSVAFPPNASTRAMVAVIDKRGPEELPQEARNQGTPVSVFEFDTTDAETGEDIGGTEGFHEPVQLTLSYAEDMIPEGVTEEELVVSFFDEAEGAWEQIPEEAVIEVDTQNNTITVATTHASYWAVMDDDGVDDTATAVRAIGWGGLKDSIKR